MSELMVCCPLSTGDDDAPAFYLKRKPRARKAHQCDECHESIPAGATYEHVNAKWGDYVDSVKTCMSCVEIRTHFSCGNGFIHYQLWSDLEENFFPEMKAGGPCMEGLSPAAKARLFERRLKWYEEQNS